MSPSTHIPRAPIWLRVPTKQWLTTPPSLPPSPSRCAGDQVRRNSGSSKRQHSAPEYLERRRAYKRASFNQKLRLRSRDRKSSLDSRADSVAEQEEEERARKTSTASCPDEKRVRRAGARGRMNCMGGCAACVRHSL